MFKVLDIFSGIGGFSLGLEAAGFHTVAFCEILPFPRRVLAHHWPGVPIYDDVRELTGERLAADGIDVDVICGGFPCQDVSNAGSRDGIDGARSRLWEEFARLVREVRPAYVIVENASALLSRGMGRVLGDMAALGFDAEWHCIPASAIGAPHVRDRVWIIAYPRRRDLAHADGERCAGVERRSQTRQTGATRRPGADDLPDAEGDLWRTGAREGIALVDGVQSGNGRPEVADADRPRLEIVFTGDEGQLEAAVGAHPWAFEPGIRRMAHGVPARMDKLAALGNAVVPPIPYLIGRAILAYETRDG